MYRKLALVLFLMLGITGITGCKKRVATAPSLPKIEVHKYDQALPTPPPQRVIVKDPVPIPLPGQLKATPGAKPLSDDALTRLREQFAKAAIEPPRLPEGWINAIARYNWMPGALYQIYASPGHITDIQLQPGETMTGPPVAGDTERWSIFTTSSGTDAGRRDHILLKPTFTDITTNMAITTDKRVYYLEIVSTPNETYHAGVSWYYPAEVENIAYSQAGQKNVATGGKGPDRQDAADTFEPKFNPADLNFGYTLSGAEPQWRPLRVFDNGEKTYIQFPEQMKYADAPVLFIRTDGKLELSNYRHLGNYYVIDRLFDEAILTIGEKKQTAVLIKRG